MNDSMETNNPQTKLIENGEKSNEHSSQPPTGNGGSHTRPVQRNDDPSDETKRETQADEDVVTDLDTAMSAMDTQARELSSLVYACPYHGPAFRFSSSSSHGRGQSPVQRYMAEGCVEEPAVFVGVDGKTSRERSCICWKAVDAVMRHEKPSGT